jgi:hypothetical protein
MFSHLSIWVCEQIEWPKCAGTTQIFGGIRLMSNKSGVSGEVISLPKGSGAMHGNGEKFSPDLHTRTGNFTVPIALPAGRK